MINMTLNDVRDLFGYQTEIYLMNNDDDFLITNILWGTVSFAGMKVNDIKVIDGKIMIAMHDMPKNVFNAWKKYAER